MKKDLLILLVIIYCICAANGQDIVLQIDALVEKAARINQFNGSVLVSIHGKTVYEKAYGFRDEEKQVLTTPGTIYQAGSTTREFTGAVILQLADGQLFIQRNNPAAIELFAHKADAFFQKDDEIRVAFQNEKGVTDMITICEVLNTKKGEKIKNYQVWAYLADK